MSASASPTSSGPRRFYVDVLGFEPWRELTFPDSPSDRLLRLTPPVDMTACYLRMDGFVLELLHFAGSGAAPSPSGNGR